MRKVLVCLLLLLFVVHSSFSDDVVNTSKTFDISRYRGMSLETLLKTGNSYLDRNVNDSAFVCYSLINNKPIKDADTASLQIVCESLNKASTISFYHGDYKSVLELLLRALKICEDIGYYEYIGRIYNNIGNVHYQFKNSKLAKRYYKLAYNNSTLPYVKGASLNNWGLVVYTEDNIDSALMLYRKAYNLQDNSDDPINSAALNNIALIHQTLKRYDSAFLYYRMALNIARRLKHEEKEAKTLSNIGQLHLEVRNFDSAMYYIEKSNVLVNKSNFTSILASNYLYLSEIENLRGNKASSFDYYKMHSALKDSLFNAYKYRTVSELQFMYDMAKVDQQIKELNLEQSIKERTILMQRRLQVVMILILLTVVGFMLLLYFKNKNLNSAYNTLVNKNMEIINSDKQNYQLKLEYEDKLKEKDLLIEKILTKGCDIEIANDKVDKSSNSVISDEYRHELELAILDIMNDRAVFCDSDFSITKLSEMVNSNPTYISWIINNSFNKNFNTFVNDYRIKEACRILSDSEYKKYSIETIATMVGFKSKGSFNPIFKEITGVTPSFYAKSIRVTL